MTYSNINPSVTQDTASFASMPIYYNTIPVLENIPHDSQLVVERIFTTELAGSANTLEDFLASPNVSPYHKRQIFKIPNDRMEFNQITKTITSVDLPTSGTNVYKYITSGFNVSVPPITVGQKITVERKTISNIPLITWVPGSKLTTLQLNRAATQNLFLTQEILSLIDRKIAYDGNATVTIPDSSITSTKIAAGAILPYHLSTVAGLNWAIVGDFSISSLTASLPLFSDANKKIVTRSITGVAASSVVLQDSPTLITPNLGTPSALTGTNITGTAANFTSNTCTTIPALSGNVTSSGNVVTLNATQSGITILGTLSALAVSGLSSLGSLTVSGSSSLTSLAVSGTSTLGVIEATGNASITGNLNIIGNISWSGSATGTTATTQQVVNPIIFLAASPCAFTASISGTTLDVTVMGNNQFLSIGSTIVGSGVTLGTRVTAYGNATGAVGTYTVTPSQTTASTAMTGTGSSSALSNGGGIALMADGAGGNKTITCDTAAGTWNFNQGIKLSSGKALILQGSTSGTVTITPAAAAGTPTLTLPTTSDILIGRDTTDTLTNKTWNSNVIAGLYGGTGVSNSGKTITLAGNLTTAGGAFNTTLTVGANTNVTLPSSGTLITDSSANTLTNKTWNGNVIAGIYGGTGVANSNKTITVGGNLTTTPAFDITFTSSNTTNLTLPSSGVLATLANNETLSNKTLSASFLGTPLSGNLSNCTNIPISGLTGTLGVGNGGTGLTTTVAKSVLITGTNSITPLLIGTPNQVLRVNSGGTDIEWGGSGGGVLATSGGGTGQTNTAWTPGCIVIGSSTTGQLTTLDQTLDGSYDGAVLTADSTQPNGVKWGQAPGTGGGTGGEQGTLLSGHLVIDTSSGSSTGVNSFTTTTLYQNIVNFTNNVSVMKQINCRQFALGSVHEYIVYMPTGSSATLVQFNLSQYNGAMGIRLELRSKAGHYQVINYAAGNTEIQVTGITASGTTAAFPSPFNVATSYKVFAIKVTQNFLPYTGAQRVITVENLLV